MNTVNTLSVVINYCPNEKKFIERQLEECLKFSDDIVVVQTTHYLNGEEIGELEKFGAYDIIHDIVLPFSQEAIDTSGSRSYHNYFRHKGWEKTKHDYVMFLDADEIPDGERVAEWLKMFKLKLFNVVTLDAYWYFRDSTNQATTTEETVLIFKSDLLYQDIFYNDHERWGMLKFPKMVRRHIDPISKEPLVHHYSWVRTEEEMLRKVSSWGHRDDSIAWDELVKEEFEHEFNGTDFVHGYDYKKVDSFI